MQIKRGDVYYAGLDPVTGHETGKTRPVLIIQNDIGNQYSPTTIVAVITEYSPKKASYPICVPIRKQEGLSKDSIVNLSQIRTVDKKRLLPPRLATLSADIMQQVDAAIINSLGL
ncbi:MAG: type II toxin-antitoxin system PemK/MazF family toxin [Desulfosalsimonadaceae bacterium]